jgi:hypothetical protein
MSRRATGIAVVGLLLLLQACGTAGADPDHDHTPQALDPSDPVQVVAAIFAVAGGHLGAAVLGKLCDPLGHNDIDTRRICDYAAGFDPDGEFPMFFKAGRLNGAAFVEGDRAWVPFLFGPDGDRPDTMQLVRRDGNWYLLEF